MLQPYSRLAIAEYFKSSNLGTSRYKVRITVGMDVQGVDRRTSKLISPWSECQLGRAKALGVSNIDVCLFYMHSWVLC